ncbi:unnamed protein product [Phaeothamnion confervicola]
MQLPPALSTGNNDHVSTIYRAIEHCTLSPLLEVRQPAEALLSACEEVPGFSDVLVAIAATETATADARIAAVILLKKLVHARWRQRGGRARNVAPEEKQRVRAFLLVQLSEPDPRVAAQLAVLAAKVARADWPREWPDLFPTLVEGASSSNNALRQARSLLLLQQTLKELTTKRIGLDRMAFVRACADMFAPLRVVWLALLPVLAQAAGPVSTSTTTAAAGARGSGTSAGIATACDCLLLATKALCLVMVEGTGLLEHPEAPSFFMSLLEAMSSAISRLCALGRVRAVDGAASHDVEQVQKILRRLAKTAVKAQKSDPLGFRHYLAVYLHFFYGRLAEAADAAPSAAISAGGLGGGCEGGRGGNGNDEGLPNDPYPHDRFTMQCAWFLSNVLSCSAYRKDTLMQAAAKATPAASTAAINTAAAASRGGLSAGRLITARGDVVVTEDVAAAVGTALQESFTPPLVEALVGLCLRRLLLLTPAEVGEWESDPEGFFTLQESLGATESLRVSGQHLFLALLESPDVGPSVVAPFLVRAIMSTDALAACNAEATAAEAAAAGAFAAGGVGGGPPNSPPPLPPQALLELDALYQAAGLGASSLQSAGLDIAGWWRSYLAPGLQRLVEGAGVAAHLCAGQGSSPPSPLPRPILLRRFLWVVGCYVDQIDPADHAPLVRAVAHVLAIGSGGGCGGDHDRAVDVVARLAAVAALSSVVELWTADVAVVIAPQLAALTEGMCRLVAALEELETRQQVLTVLAAAYERCAAEAGGGVALASSAGAAALAAVAHLPAIWQGTQHQPPVLVLCVTLFTHVVKCLGLLASGKLDAAAPASATNSSGGGGTKVSGLTPVNSLALALLRAALARSCVASPGRPEETAARSVAFVSPVAPLEEEESFLLTSGLELWLELMQHVQTYDSELHALFGRLPVVAATAAGAAAAVIGGAVGGVEPSEHMKTEMALVEAYTLVGGADFLQAYGDQVCVVFASLAGDVRPKGAAILARTAETALICFPREFSCMLVARGAADSLLAACIDGGGSQQPDAVKVQYLPVLCRVLLGAPEAFAAVFERRPEGAGSALEGFVATIARLFDAAGAGGGGARRRKLWALALLGLLPLGLMSALQRMDSIVNICVDVLTEADAGNGNGAEGGGGGGGGGGDDGDGATHALPRSLRRLLASDDASDRSGSENDEAHSGGGGGGGRNGELSRRPRRASLLARRRRRALLTDLVVMADLRAAVVTAMDHCRAAVGTDLFSEAMSSCEPVLLAQLQAAVGGTASANTITSGQGL